MARLRSRGSNDSLGGSIVSGQPLRLGKRSVSLPFRGDLADLRLYRRTLSPQDVRELSTWPVLAMARMPAARRSKALAEQLARYFKTCPQLEPVLFRAVI